MTQDFLAQCPATADWSELTAVLRSHGQRGDDPVAASLCWQFEPVHRRLLVDEDFRQALRASRATLEPRLLEQLCGVPMDWQAAAEQASAWHRHWQAEAGVSSSSLPLWWRRKAAQQG